VARPAHRPYELIDADPSHMSPAQVADEIRLLPTTLAKVWLLGAVMRNLPQLFPDCPATVTIAELEQLENVPNEQTWKLQAPAESLTRERLKGARSQLPANAK